MALGPFMARSKVFVETLGGRTDAVINISDHPVLPVVIGLIGYRG